MAYLKAPFVLEEDTLLRGAATGDITATTSFTIIDGAEFAANVIGTSGSTILILDSDPGLPSATNVFVSGATADTTVSTAATFQTSTFTLGVGGTNTEVYFDLRDELIVREGTVPTATNGTFEVDRLGRVQVTFSTAPTADVTITYVAKNAPYQIVVADLSGASAGDKLYSLPTATADATVVTHSASVVDDTAGSYPGVPQLSYPIEIPAGSYIESTTVEAFFI